MLSGCGNSSSTADNKVASPAPPQTPNQAAAPTPPATPSQPTTPTAPAPVAVAQEAASSTPTIPTSTTTRSTDSSSAVTSATAQLSTTAKAQNDPVLSSVGTELADKVNALAQTSPGNTDLNSKLTSSVQSLAAGKDSSALSSFYQSVQSTGFTPQQTQLAKEVGNLASAYVVQRNFSSVQGAQGDVATIVSSLRKGEITPMMPALKNVAQNASLTQPQKDLLGSIADKYAPGLSKATGTLQQGLNSLGNLGK
jgi:hypothetical protein